ncbi:aldo/keto reductase [Variovorax sp. J22R133]|uniref:aldo/keto reductase family protein n=1 Tax=Variovorax brevis TaxID=3053503 RepID=UPI0025758631|nr:aldo/keto reductase [Variovorax sp. J22R133]MDM0118028.1 aldo/keto reductase [Variovorax sp. J22R133]
MLYGTAWKEARTTELTALALAQGFIGVDTANQRRHYHEAGVGEAISAFVSSGRCARSDLFLQTKFTYAVSHDDRIPYDAKASFATQVRQSFERSLLNLNTDYVDSYLLHGPSRAGALGPPDWEVWRALESLQREGKTRWIGVSNLTLKQLIELNRYAEIRPTFVQNRCCARNGWDREIRAFCRSTGILYQGFSLLTANARELEHPVVQRLVARTGRSLAQIVLRFALQIGIVPLTGTTNVENMKDDMACLDFKLEPSDVDSLESIGISVA